MPLTNSVGRGCPKRRIPNKPQKYPPPQPDERYRAALIRAGVLRPAK